MLNLQAVTERQVSCRGPVLVLWAFVLAGVGLASGGCTPASIPGDRNAAVLEEVQTHGVIIGFEGLQPFSGFAMDELVTNVGQDTGLAHLATSGNYLSHLPIIEEAHKHGEPVYLVGYSLGGDQARRLAEECQKRNIPVRILFLLDPRYMAALLPGKVPGNVERAVFYTSATYDATVGVVPKAEHLADANQTDLFVEDMPEVGHMALPAYVTERVKSEIFMDIRR